MRRFAIALTVLLALLAGNALAQQFSTLEERMTYAEFKAAGLDKLTPEELAALNDWLAGKVASAATVASAGDQRGFEGRTSVAGAVVSTIDGSFKGWKGKGDRFTLANGQVWEVTDSGTRLSVNLENPTVVIEQGALGSWSLRVTGYNARARVKRIK
jgi:hypothetical protein